MLQLTGFGRSVRAARSRRSGKSSAGRPADATITATPDPRSSAGDMVTSIEWVEAPEAVARVQAELARQRESEDLALARVPLTGSGLGTWLPACLDGSGPRECFVNRRPFTLNQGKDGTAAWLDARPGSQRSALSKRGSWRGDPTRRAVPLKASCHARCAAIGMSV